MNIKNSNVFNINEDSSGQRLDNFLIKKLKGIPKSLIYKLVRSGQVRVNKKRSKVSYRIQSKMISCKNSTKYPQKSIYFKEYHL